ncbi:HAMP domain-containing histidine kinase [Clostridium estertheticum]|uniref:sensor histidine kinase n=1 Tax=Clostridium estertheticum TaxID=238834 RepID=UPI001CF56093|nr:HAMP domain-containing sensor histidine kinase [Clostridium estertheticum]MCB2307283.1 HAMP domain-containing histidine kinase [Clostridium estertheticum]MCB2344932.1 HAMP domain-containing histidine kinase [Clostridium estertheticum]MCB2349905.1 HAMP domain-containing histidine kinase [Clostridium estertheticum]WAG48173.1 HAMP domain-containing histidine kinase [Clostridium estertheticum]
MKIKKWKWKWNYYILAFIIFRGLMLFSDFKVQGPVKEFFEKRILFDGEKVLFSGMEVIRGTFYWQRLKDILMNMVICGFVLLEIVVYFTSRYSQNKQRKKTITQLEQRISLLRKGEVPEKVQELNLIDSEINEIRHENELVKQEILMEMSKKNDLVTYLAHDLKTPLTSIVGYLTILDESEVPEKVRRDYIKKLLEKSYRMEDLTNQFFDITRFSLQEIPLNKSLLDAAFFLEQLTEELYPLLKEKNLKFDINLTPGIKIYADGSLFARALNNLLKNAIAYSHKDSVIKIKTEMGKCSMKLFVENDGDVISQQELKLIFEKFYRRDQSRSQSNGAGLGLAIAREIVQKHQGSLDAKSQDGHTVFIITLPNS